MPSPPEIGDGEQAASFDDEASMKANEKYLHDFFIKHQKTILENTIQEYRVMFIYDNIPLLLGYVCLFVLGLVANGVQIYATILQIRRRENTVCSKMFLQLAISQTLLIVYLIPMDYLWRYSQVWEAGERACQILVWIRFYLIVTVAAFTVLQTFVRYRVMRASAEVVDNNNNNNNNNNSCSILLTTLPSGVQQTNDNYSSEVSKKGESVRSRNRSTYSRYNLPANSQSRQAFLTTNSNAMDSGSLNFSKENRDVDNKKNTPIFMKRWFMSIGNSLANVCWPTRRLIAKSQSSSSSSSSPKASASMSSSTASSELWRRVAGEKKRNFNENRLILLGWLLPLILCAPEAAVYKLHVHKDIGGYQQCADIFVKQEELLFPRLFPSSATEEGDLANDNNLFQDQDRNYFLFTNNNETNNDESSAIAALIYDISSGSGDGQHNVASYLAGSVGNAGHETTTAAEQSDLTTTLLASDIDLTSMDQSDAALTPVQIVYYLLLQSLTFVIPVGAILILNGLVVRCYWRIRRRNNHFEQYGSLNSNNNNNNNVPSTSNTNGSIQQESGATDDNRVERSNQRPLEVKEEPSSLATATTKIDDPLLLAQQHKQQQLRELRNWAAHRTLFLTLSFGVSYVVCWFPMAMLMATRWNALFIRAPSPDSTMGQTMSEYDVTSEHAMLDGDNGAYFHSSSLDTTDIAQDYSSLGFWAFIEEWAIAWGLMIGVINPLLYGLFHLLGGNHKRLYDLQFCPNIAKTASSSRSTTTDRANTNNISSNTVNNSNHKAHLQQLFSCRQNGDRSQSLKKMSIPSRNLTSRYSHYTGQQRLGQPKVSRPSNEQCQISQRRISKQSSYRRNRSVDEVTAGKGIAISGNNIMATIDEK